jgi:hypothetical protein
LISDSPVTIWQISPEAVQCASGKRGEKPGMVMFWARRSNSGIPYHTSASGANMLIMKTFGARGLDRFSRWESWVMGMAAAVWTRARAVASLLASWGIRILNEEEGFGGGCGKVADKF